MFNFYKIIKMGMMIYLTSVCFIFIKLFAFFVFSWYGKDTWTNMHLSILWLIFLCSCLIQLIAFEDSYFFRIFFSCFFLFLLPRRFKLIFAWNCAYGKCLVNRTFRKICSFSCQNTPKNSNSWGVNHWRLHVKNKSGLI